MGQVTSHHELLYANQPDRRDKPLQSAAPPETMGQRTKNVSRRRQAKPNNPRSYRAVNERCRAHVLTGPAVV